ncbi:MAG TPA: CopD family protein [Azonexus sp.]|nr:CopD family protein [Azonexus sp.]
MHSFLLLLHLAGVVVWVGGMFFAHFCLRPVAALQLPPPQRLPLLAAVLGRFFTAVAVSIVAILVSGFTRMLTTGFASAPLHWHVMSGLGLVMVAIFGVIYFLHFPRLKAGVAIQNWPAAGVAMNRIRLLVATNLILGAVTICVATLGTYIGQ